MKFVPTTNLYLYLQYINMLYRTCMYTYMSFKCERSTEIFFFLFFFYSRRQFKPFPCDHLKMPYYIDGINTHTCTHTHPQPKMQTNKQTITTEKPAAKTLFKLFRWSLWTHITVRKTFSLVILTELSVCVWIALSSFFCCWKKIVELYIHMKIGMLCVTGWGRVVHKLLNTHVQQGREMRERENKFL